MPKLHFKALDIETVHTIARWVYQDTGTGLYMKPYQESYLETPGDLRGPGGCEGYGVYLDDELFGLFEYTFVEGEMEIGCAIAPKFRGKGYGADFVQAGVAFGVSELGYTGTKVGLSVAVTNVAARKVYEKVGFLIRNSNQETIWMYKKI
jgi:ribosomal-protein-alanine N-acetyltransferase